MRDRKKNPLTAFSPTWWYPWISGPLRSRWPWTTSASSISGWRRKCTTLARPSTVSSSWTRLKISNWEVNTTNLLTPLHFDRYQVIQGILPRRLTNAKNTAANRYIVALPFLQASLSRENRCVYILIQPISITINLGQLPGTSLKVKSVDYIWRFVQSRTFWHFDILIQPISITINLGQLPGTSLKAKSVDYIWRYVQSRTFWGFL